MSDASVTELSHPILLQYVLFIKFLYSLATATATIIIYDPFHVCTKQVNIALYEQNIRTIICLAGATKNKLRTALKARETAPGFYLLLILRCYDKQNIHFKTKRIGNNAEASIVNRNIL